MECNHCILMMMVVGSHSNVKTLVSINLFLPWNIFMTQMEMELLLKSKKLLIGLGKQVLMKILQMIMIGVRMI